MGKYKQGRRLINSNVVFTGYFMIVKERGLMGNVKYDTGTHLATSLHAWKKIQMEVGLGFDIGTSG